MQGSPWQTVARQAEPADTPPNPWVASPIGSAPKATYGFFTGSSETWLSLLHSARFSSERILDLGCGIGVNTTYLAKHHPEAEFVGVDSCPEAIGCAETIAEEVGVSNAHFILGDLASVDGSFDTVLGSTFIVDAEPTAFTPTHGTAMGEPDLAELAATSRSAHVDRIASLLPAGGLYLALERCPTPLEGASFVGAALSAGLSVLVDSIGLLPIGSPPDEHLTTLGAVKTDSDLTSADHYVERILEAVRWESGVDWPKMAGHPSPSAA